MSKKFFRKSLSVLLCITVLLSCGVLTCSVSAVTWEEHWNNYCNDGSALYISPGSDETSRGISWYSPSGSDRCFVDISADCNMDDAIRFYGNFVKTPENDRRNNVTVTGLSLGTKYFYRCGVGEDVLDTYSFSTLPTNDFTVFYTNDIHINGSSLEDENTYERSYNLYTTLNAAFEKNSDISFVLSGGDQATHASRCEYIGLVASPVFRSIEFALSIGNHDRGEATYKYFKNVPNEYTDYITSSYVGSDYWFVKGDALFLMLDSNNKSAKDHRDFVKNAVDLNPDVKWKVAVFHHDLYGGRIESRESENKFLRKLFTPIFDEFKIDFALMGHSHYYTISNVMYDDKSVMPTTDLNEVINPNGTIYMASGSINSPRFDPDAPLGKNIGKAYLTEEKIYNIIEFTDDSISIHSYTVESGEEFESFTITKTTQDGGHPDFSPGFTDNVLRWVSVVSAFFDNLGKTMDYFETYLITKLGF